MTRDMVFLLLFLAILVVVAIPFFLMVQTGEPIDPPPGATPHGATGTATTSGTAAGEPLPPVTRTDGTVWDPDSKESKEALKEASTGKKTVEEGDSSTRARLDQVVESVDFKDADMADVFAALEAECGLKFHAPDHILRGGDNMKVTLRAEKITVRSVIELVVLTKRLSWEARPDGTIHIGEGD